MNNPSHEVKPVKVSRSNNFEIFGPDWKIEERVYGWFPAIFGPGWFPGYSMQCSALDHIDGSHNEPRTELLYGTPEEAMTAWELADPVEMSKPQGFRNRIRPAQVDEINELGLYRHLDPEKELKIPKSTESTEEDPDPDLWKIENTKEIEF